MVQYESEWVRRIKVEPLILQDSFMYQGTEEVAKLNLIEEAMDHLETFPLFDSEHS